MRHIIFGGSGFTGSHLALGLRQHGKQVLLADTRPLAPELSQAGFEFVHANILSATQLGGVPIGPDDVVHHMAARQYHEKVPHSRRDEWFDEVNVIGSRHILERMERAGCRRMVYFSTDMVYGKPKTSPVPVSHEQNPVGPYGGSKKKSEAVCREFRAKGFDITIFRPRLIVGPGRLGILERLFTLIRRNLPVPLIGNGRNRYQMVSVHDCVSAVLCAVEKAFPNAEFNLGSEDPPTVRELLDGLVRQLGSRSLLVPLPAAPLKVTLGVLDYFGLPLMYGEQFAIADADYIVDVRETKDRLGWQPEFRDGDMLREAYKVYMEKSPH